MLVTAAVFNRVANNKPKLDPKKDMFDADKLRRGEKEEDKQAKLQRKREQMKLAQQDMKEWSKKNMKE